MHPIAAWKELYNLDTDPQISTSKQTSCAKHTFGFLPHRHRRNERHAKATSEATMPFLVGSTQWLWYLHSIRLGRKSQSPGGTYLPHLIRESSRMKGSEWQKFTLPHYVPIQTSLSEGPLQRAAPRQDAPRAPRLHFLSPFSAPAPDRPQPDRQQHNSTLFRHNPPAPPKPAHVYRLRAWGCSTKNQRHLVVLGELWPEALWNGGQGTTAVGDALEKPLCV